MTLRSHVSGYSTQCKILGSILEDRTKSGGWGGGGGGWWYKKGGNGAANFCSQKSFSPLAAFSNSTTAPALVEFGQRIVALDFMLH